MQDHMRAFLRSLDPQADPGKQADGYFRCYCKVLHEYHNFNWFDGEECPHVFDSCDDFVEYEPKDDDKLGRPRPGKRERPASHAVEENQIRDPAPAG